MAETLGRLQFMFFSAMMIYPIALAALALALALLSGGLRARLRADGVARWAFVGVFALWAALVPWGAVWLDAMDGKRVSPGWAYWPIIAVLAGWPLIAGVLVVRARGARVATLLYVLCNAPGWLFGSAVCGMAVAGDWL